MKPMSTPKGSFVKKQHFVPQSYLLRFANEDERVCVYDKVLEKSYWNHVENVAQENGFYEPPKALLRLDPANAKSQVWEKSFNVAETVASVQINKVLNSCISIAASDKSSKVLDMPEDRAFIVLYAVMQMLRTKDAREYVWTESAEATARFAPPETFALGGTIDDYKKFLSSEPIRYLQHLEWLTAAPSIIAPIISKMRLTVGINRTDSALLTSDAPVAKAGLSSEKSRPFQDLLNLDSLITFPLSPTVVIVFRPPGNDSRKEVLDGYSFSLDESEVLHLNRSQLRQCHRQIYSASERQVLSLAQS